MAFPNGTGDRFDELRFRSQQASRNDSPLLGLVSPPRNGTRLPPPTANSNDGRTNLTRRFTTDSGRVPTLNSLASQRGQDAQDYTNVSETLSLLANVGNAHNVYNIPIIAYWGHSLRSIISSLYLYSSY